MALIAAGVAVAVVLFIVAQPGDDNDDSDESKTQTTQQSTDTGGGAGQPLQVPHAEPEPERIVVRGGEVQGGVKEIDVDRGEPVRLVVTADAADEVHVHGYDLMEEVAPGKPARVQFKADTEGIFEIELEGRGLQIAELTVEP